MNQRNPLQVLKEARQIALDNGCFVVPKGDRYLVYRKGVVSNTYLGFRRDPAALRAFVCRVTNFK